jgi:aryl-alcohol dehydrogenase-like predicted oxidoreductase
LLVVVMVPLGSGRLVRNAPSERDLEPLREFGVETWAQVLLKFVLSDERVSCAIPATSKPERALENARAGEPPFFGEEEREYVSRLVRGR